MSKRWAAKQRTCPKCLAPPGVACESTDGQGRASVHQQRLKSIDSDVVNNMPFRPTGEFYQSDSWRRVRYKALWKHGGACQLCGNRATPESPIHVDHIKPRSKFPRLALELSNLQVLCEDCNAGKSNDDDTDWRK